MGSHSYEGWSYASEWGEDDCLDLGPKTNGISGKRTRPIVEITSLWASMMRRQVSEFERWRRSLGLGLDGKVQRLSSTAKTTARKVLTLMSRPR
jgi:hypothetical protein